MQVESFETIGLKALYFQGVETKSAFNTRGRPDVGSASAPAPPPPHLAAVRGELLPIAQQLAALHLRDDLLAVRTLRAYRLRARTGTGVMSDAKATQSSVRRVGARSERARA